MYFDEIWRSCQKKINVFQVFFGELFKYGKVLYFFDILSKNKKKVINVLSGNMFENFDLWMFWNVKKYY